MSGDISYNLMQKGEEKAVHNLISRVFEEFVAPGYLPEGRENFLKFASAGAIEERNRNGESFLLTARDGQKIIGVLEIKGCSHICLLFVDSDYFRQGIARSLLKIALKKCLQDEEELSQLTVNSSPYAVKIYEKMGFEKTGGEVEKDGIRYIPMKKMV